MNDFAPLLKDLTARAESVQSAADLAALRREVLGKSGALMQALRSLGKLPADERRSRGESVNAAKKEAEDILAAREASLAAAPQARAVKGGSDVTLPGRRQLFGSPHPLRLIEHKVLDVLLSMGFRLSRGPLVEHEWFNFGALNMAPDHPARDMQDTFFVAPEVVLRTHTSNVQVRQMLLGAPPVRVVAPGMVFRHDEVDATHTPVFHQIEALWIDDHTTLADLKGLLRALLTHLFGPSAQIRLRPSYFPFTEPSVEVDVSCVVCTLRGQKTSKRCPTCRGSGWIEILGAGLTHPNVLRAVGYDPERVQGFAFGMGLERAAMLAYGIEDIRLLYDNDLRFLAPFGPQLGPTLAGPR